MTTKTIASLPQEQFAAAGAALALENKDVAAPPLETSAAAALAPEPDEATELVKQTFGKLLVTLLLETKSFAYSKDFATLLDRLKRKGVKMPSSWKVIQTCLALTCRTPSWTLLPFAALAVARRWT